MIFTIKGTLRCDGYVKFCSNKADADFEPRYERERDESVIERLADFRPSKLPDGWTVIARTGSYFCPECTNERRAVEECAR